MTTYEIVEFLLRQYPAVRNNDKLLIWNVWGSLSLLTNGLMTREHFLNAPTPESITRARRKVVELHPELDATDPVIREARKRKEEEKGDFIFQQ